MTGLRRRGLKLGFAALALSKKSCTAADAIACSRRTSLGGNRSGPTGTSSSPPRPSGWRLVARILTPGAPARIPSTRSAHAPARCSQLSRTSNRRRPRRWSMRRSAMGRLDPPSIPSVRPTVSATSRGSLTSARGTNQTPSLNWSSSARPTSMASRDFPVPPEPTSVTSGRLTTRAVSAANSPSRPTKVVSGAGRLPVLTPTDRMAGNSRLADPRSTTDRVAPVGAGRAGRGCRDG